MVDLVIRGATVADGTGAELREADVAIDKGCIVTVGDVRERGCEEVDARGLLVTPGFVDLHTHYDGQLVWSETLEPSSTHGVTTVVAGNCGVGFAPCRPADRERLIRLMEGIEDVPEAVMAEGLDWRWESFDEYLHALEQRPHDLDFSVMLPHSPLRVFVMGERATNLEPSTDDDRAQMRRIAAEAMRAGASGFSTSRSIFHRSSDGLSVPTLKAEEAELTEIALGLGDAGQGVLQAITMTGENRLEDYEILHRVAIASGRPMSYTTIQIDAAKDLWRDIIRSVDRDNRTGADLRMQVFNRPIGLIMGLETTLHPFCMHPYYLENLKDLPLAERVKRMSRPDVRAILIEPAGDLDHPLRGNVTRFHQTYAMGEVVDYEPDPATSVAAIATARGASPYEVMLDMLLERGGHAKLWVASSNYSERTLDPTLEMMRHERAVVGLGDGGAHYGLICDASYPTFMLTHWARDRRGDKLEIADAVRMLTDAPARLQRFADRGRIEAGMKADINIIDFDHLKLFAPDVINDLPAGGPRLHQRVEGIVATYVNGVQVRREGCDTGARPGRLVRGCPDSVWNANAQARRST